MELLWTQSASQLVDWPKYVAISDYSYHLEVTTSDSLLRLFMSSTSVVNNGLSFVRLIIEIIFSIMCHEFNGYFLQTSLAIVCDLLVPTPAALKSIGIIKERATYIWLEQITMCVGPSLPVVLLSTHIVILKDLHNCGMGMIMTQRSALEEKFNYHQ